MPPRRSRTSPRSPQPRTASPPMSPSPSPERLSPTAPATPSPTSPPSPSPSLPPKLRSKPQRKLSPKQKQSPGKRLLSFDRRLGARFVAGADEAGRGSLAGPLVVAGVLLDYSSLRDHRVRPLALLNDSKQV